MRYSLHNEKFIYGSEEIMLLFTYVGNKDETKDRCKDSKDNLNYGQDICSEGNDQV